MLSIAYHLRCYQLLSISKSKRFAAILVCIFRLFFSMLSKTLCSKDCATSTRVKNSRDQVLDNSICKSVSLLFWRIVSWTMQLTSSRFLSGDWVTQWLILWQILQEEGCPFFCRFLPYVGLCGLCEVVLLFWILVLMFIFGGMWSSVFVLCIAISHFVSDISVVVYSRWVLL